MGNGICKMCGGIYKPNGLDYCDKCFEEYKEKYEVIKEYLSNHNNVTIMELAKETRISLKVIRLLLENEALSLKVQKG
jgi:hypothetical protein